MFYWRPRRFKRGLAYAGSMWLLSAKNPDEIRMRQYEGECEAGTLLTALQILKDPQPQMEPERMRTLRDFAKRRSTMALEPVLGLLVPLSFSDVS